MGLCSQCFRAHQTRVGACAEASPAPAPAAAEAASPSPAPAASPEGFAASPAVAPVASLPLAPVEDPGPVPSPAEGRGGGPATPAAPTVSCVMVGEGGAEEGGPPERPVQKNPGRCWKCNKKVGLTGFKCKCGYVFCGTHRYAGEHNCDFDYKTTGREAIAKANPVVVAPKMERF